MSPVRFVLSWLTGGAIDLLQLLRRWAGKLWQAMLRNPWRTIAMGFSIVILINAFLLHSERGENAQLRADIKEIAKGQKQARRAQIAVNHAPVVLSQAIAKESRANAEAYYEAGRRAGLAYRAANRVPAPAPVSAASGAGVPGADRPAAQHDGPGDAADLVAITTANFDTCTVNSQRIARVRADALALIAAGVAVADTAKGGE